MCQELIFTFKVRDSGKQTRISQGPRSGGNEGANQKGHENRVLKTKIKVEGVYQAELGSIPNTKCWSKWFIKILEKGGLGLQVCLETPDLQRMGRQSLGIDFWTFLSNLVISFRIPCTGFMAFYTYN